jgi:hypothetical protein
VDGLEKGSILSRGSEFFKPSTILSLPLNALESEVSSQNSKDVCFLTPEFSIKSEYFITVGYYPNVDIQAVFTAGEVSTLPTDQLEICITQIKRHS